MILVPVNMTSVPHTITPMILGTCTCEYNPVLHPYMPVILVPVNTTLHASNTRTCEYNPVLHPYMPVILVPVNTTLYFTRHNNDTHTCKQKPI